MIIRVTYPHNPTGTLEECNITDEYHTVRTNDNSWRVIVPELGPFFKSGFKIIHVESSLELVEGVDFNFGTKVLSSPNIAFSYLYSTIILINKSLSGKFKIEYNSIGSNYVGIRSEVLTYLANHLIDPKTTPLEKVLDVPEFKPPHEHDMSWTDFLKTEEIAESIDKITESVIALREDVNNNHINTLKQKISQLNQKLLAFNYETHIVDTDNSHGVTSGQANALPVSGKAVGAFKAFNKKAMELANEINANGITVDDINRYVKHTGDVVLKEKIVLSDGSAVITNVLGTVSIDLSNGDVELQSKGGATLRAESGDVTITAGKNVLTVPSTLNNKLLFNGHEVYTDKTIATALSGISHSTNNVIVGESQTVKLTGTGRSDNRLKGELKTYTATLTRSGMTSLSTSASDDITSAVTPNVLKAINETIATKALKSTTINGQPLSSNVTLDATDIDLWNVDNTSDADKPITDEQQAVLDSFVSGPHQHDFAELNLSTATESELGVVNLISDPMVNDRLGAVATPAHLKNTSDLLTVATNVADSKLKFDPLELKYWSATNILADGFKCTMPNECELVMAGKNYINFPDGRPATKELDVSVLYPGGYQNQLFYFYIHNNNGTLEYRVQNSRRPKNYNWFLLFKIFTDDVGFSSFYTEGNAVRSDDEIIALPVTRIAEFKDLIEHKEERQAHFPNPSLEGLGLDQLFNYKQGLSVNDYDHFNMSNWRLRPLIPNTGRLLNVELYADADGFKGTLIDLDSDNAFLSAPFNALSNIGTGAYPLTEQATYMIESTNLKKFEVMLGVFSDSQFNERLTVEFVEGKAGLPSTGTTSLIHYDSSGARNVLTTINGFTLTGIDKYCLDYKIFKTNADEYEVSISFEQIGNTDSLIQTATLRFNSNIIECTLTAKTLVAVGTINGNTFNGPISSDISNILANGMFGIGFEFVDSAPEDDGEEDDDEELLGYNKLLIEMVAGKSSLTEETYVSNSAIYNRLRYNSGVKTIKGTTTGIIPIPSGISRYVVLYSISKIDSSGTTVPVDGMSVGLYSVKGDIKVQSNHIDISSPTRDVRLKALIKRTDQAAITVPIEAEYMVIGFRDV